MNIRAVPRSTRTRRPFSRGARAEECCNSGCIPCVYDLYNEAMDRYRDELKAWKARHPEA